MAVAESPLSEQDARALTNSIAAALGVAWDKIVRAYELRAWEPLGYASWDAFCSAEFGSSRLRLPAEERAEIVHSLRAAGLSTRAIASATGVSKGTVGNDLAGGRNWAPGEQPVTIDHAPWLGRVGLDGRVHPTSASRSGSDPELEERRARARVRRQWSSATAALDLVLHFSARELCDLLDASELDNAEWLASSIGHWGVALSEHRESLQTEAQRS